MKQSVNQLLDIFKIKKYSRIGLPLLLVALVPARFPLFQPKPPQGPIALSEVAADISAGKVLKVEDAPDTGSLTLFYKDGSQRTTRRDKAASFLEQMQYLGVSDNQM